MAAFPNMSLDEPDQAVYDPYNHSNEERTGIKFVDDPEAVPTIKKEPAGPGFCIDLLVYLIVVYPANWAVIKYVFKPTIELARWDPFREFNYGWWLLLSPIAFWVELLMMFGYYAGYVAWYGAEFLKHLF